MQTIVNELPLDGFRRAIRQTYGSESQLVGRERVDEYCDGEPVWQGEVLIFDAWMIRSRSSGPGGN